MLRGEYGPDLEEVAHYHGLQVEDVIRIHSETTYFVYMLGFTPGFPYLGGLSKELETPRKETPRLQISPGSVGIGEIKQVFIRLKHQVDGILSAEHLLLYLIRKKKYQHIFKVVCIYDLSR